MNRKNLSVWLDKVIKIAWAILFLTLPVTSFPFFPSGLGGATLVRPLAVYPLIILLVLVTVPYLINRPLPRTLLPLLAFLVIAVISSLVSLSYGLEALKGVSIASRLLRNMVTLSVGIAFYLGMISLNRNWHDLKFSLRWLYIGFGAALFWGTLQIPNVIHPVPGYFALLSKIQSLISTRKLFMTRISGMTYEPKWFAEQLCFLLLPWLLSAVVSRQSVFRWRYKWLTVEWILLLWTYLVIVFTFSRTGLFILGILTLVGAWLFRYFSRHRQTVYTSRWLRTKKRRAVIVTVVALGAIALVSAAVAQNPYFSRFWRYWTDEASRNKSYLEYIGFQQRFVYWITAFRTYEEHPLLGVGLGNYAFYFEEMLPDRPWHQQPEIVRQITPVEGRDRLITPKNLYARLLAETGLMGTIAFTSFVVAVLGCALYLWFSPALDQKYWGLCGILGILVFSIVIFSFDSFALPNMWIVFGLITAAAHLSDPPFRPPEGGTLL